MSLGSLGCYGGHGLGELCGDCHVVPVVSADLLNNRWGFGGLGAHWATPTNYDPVLHRRYGVGAYGRIVRLNTTDTTRYQRLQAPGMGEIALGTSGWMLSDVASLALVVLAAMSVWKGMNGRRH